MAGRFVAVVGPSGAGKDSLMEALCVAQPDFHRVRRVITRDADSGGEAFDAVSPAFFAAQAAAGEFALHWQAHGLHYGIPNRVHDILRRDQDVVANLSRGVLSEANRVFDGLNVLHVSAAPDVLSGRLASRGRESRPEIARRLSRSVPDLPEGLLIVEIDNSGALDDSVQTALAALYPERV